MSCFRQQTQKKALQYITVIPYHYQNSCYFWFLCCSRHTTLSNPSFHFIPFFNGIQVKEEPYQCKQNSPVIKKLNPVKRVSNRVINFSKHVLQSGFVCPNCTWPVAVVMSTRNRLQMDILHSRIINRYSHVLLYQIHIGRGRLLNSTDLGYLRGIALLKSGREVAVNLFLKGETQENMV